MEEDTAIKFQEKHVCSLFKADKSIRIMYAFDPPQVSVTKPCDQIPNRYNVELKSPYLWFFLTHCSKLNELNALTFDNLSPNLMGSGKSKLPKGRTECTSHKYNIRKSPSPEDLLEHYIEHSVHTSHVCMCHCCVMGRGFKINLDELVNMGKYKSHGNTLLVTRGKHGYLLVYL